MHTRLRLFRTPPAHAWALGLLLVLLGLPVRSRAQEAGARPQEAPAEGQFISVRSPLTSEETNRIKEVSNWAIDHVQDHSNLKLIYDFNPNNGAAADCTEFGPCNELAEFLLNLKDVTPVAFVHGDVSRHMVLPVLACKEIIMAPDRARLGPVVEDNDPPLTPTKLQGYKDVIKGRSLCPALVLKLLDRDMEVLQGVRGGAVWYLDSRREAEEKKAGVVIGNRAPVLPRGVVGYTTAQAQTFGLCQRSLDSRTAVAKVYDLPPTSLREDSLAGRNPVAVRFVVRGAVTQILMESLERRINKAVGNQQGHANLIVLQLECSGGDPMVAQHLAEYLHELRDDTGLLGVKTVAYLSGHAHNTAVLIALGCSEIALQKDADLGDLSVLAPGADEDSATDEDRDSMQVKEVRDLAEKQGYPTALVRGMIYPQAGVTEVVSLHGPRRWWLLNDKELQADQAAREPQWQVRQQIKSGGPSGQPLVLDAPRAREVRLARHVVDDLPSLYAAYGVRPEQVHTGDNDWLDDLAFWLRHPAMTIFLVMLGFTCLILELKMPGATLPGVIAALCFLVFFWAQSQNSTITALAVLLFILGLVLIGVEIFVLPGSAVLGISGVVLVVLSLTLVTLEKWPQTTHDWIGLGNTVAMFGFSLLGAVVAAFVLAWYLPHLPYVNRLILKPPAELAEEGGPALTETALQPEWASLLGAIGVAATPLRPAGKVKFGDAFVDVVAEGSYVPPGSRVQVIEVEGYRVVVKEV